MASQIMRLFSQSGCNSISEVAFSTASWIGGFFTLSASHANMFSIPEPSPSAHLPDRSAALSAAKNLPETDRYTLSEKNSGVSRILNIMEQREGSPFYVREEQGALVTVLLRSRSLSLAPTVDALISSPLDMCLQRRLLVFHRPASQ